MKKILTLLFVLATSALISQNYSHDPKVISTIVTESKSKEIKIKNESTIPEIFIIYKFKKGDRYWKKIGSVSVFSMTEAKFYVEKDGTYGFNVEGRRPIKIGSSETRYKIKQKDFEDSDNFRD
jgi:hypothetical protein